MYRTLSCDVKGVMSQKEYDVICFFTPSGVRSLLDNFPAYEQNGTMIGAFGSNTSRAIMEAGLKLHIKAPEPQVPSMIAALDRFLGENMKTK
jgi:uroporphyrinogen-III synthase